MFIKKVYKSISVVVVLLILFFSIKGCIKSKLKVYRTQAEYAWNMDSTNKELKRWQDEAGKNHVEVEVLQLEKKQLQKYTTDIEKELDIKTKQIKSVDKITTITKVVKKLVPVYHTDTINNTDTISAYTYNDNYIDISIKDSTIIIGALDTLVSTKYWKRKGFLGLGGKVNYLDISNKSPYTDLSVKAIETAPKSRIKAVIGPGGGVVWTPLGLTYGIGVNVTIPLIKIR